MVIQIRGLLVGVLLLVTGCGTGIFRGPEPTLLTANVVDPASVNAVSMFNSCQGHPYPDTGSPNSAKNYFWPNSTNYSTSTVLAEYAGCDGSVGENHDDQSANDPSQPQSNRGQTLHLYCDNSSTAIRYFHLNFDPAIVGAHFKAGDFLGYATMITPGGTAAANWQMSSNFDIAVSETNDEYTEDYFSKLSPPGDSIPRPRP